AVGNTIAHNLRVGVQTFFGCTPINNGNSIVGNSIFANIVDQIRFSKGICIFTAPAPPPLNPPVLAGITFNSATNELTVSGSGTAGDYAKFDYYGEDNCSQGASPTGAQSISFVPFLIDGSGMFNKVLPVGMPISGGFINAISLRGTSSSLPTGCLALTTCAPPAISAQPTNKTACSGSSTSFSLGATGTNLTYRWRKNGNQLSDGGNISGATTAELAINPVSAADVGSYDVVVMSGCGNVTSNPASLTLNSSPQITAQPTNASACAGQSANFSVTASGLDLSYQWRKSFTPIPGATNSSFTISPVNTSDAGSYDVVVTNSCGSVPSSTVTLSVDSPPSINEQPSSVAACAGQPASFSVSASGTNISHQWRKNNINIFGANGASFTILSVSTGDAGSYDVVLSSSCGFVTSSAATLTVNTSAGVNANPSNQAVCAGSNAMFTASPTGSPSPAVQWQVSTNGGASFSNVTGATSTTLTVALVTSAQNNNRYRAVFTNLCGAATSNAATLTVNNCGTSRRRCDFDGDNKSDISIWRPSTGGWFVINSSNGQTPFSGWGTAGDVSVPADYDADGKTDLAVFRPSNGTWYIINSSTGQERLPRVSWGQNGDVPVPADYDSDGKADLAVWRPSTGTWFIIDSSTNQPRPVVGWGVSSDKPVPGDYDADGKADIAVWRPSTGGWFVINSTTSQATFFGWGTSGDVAVPADYDADGKTDYAVFRPSNGFWYIITSSTGQERLPRVSWGQNGDLPVPGDYDNDGESDLAVWRPSSGTWFIIDSSTDQPRPAVGWGINGDVALPGAFIRP
ncbi:MAG: immunoglobulin domain-containing protein, partial [Blastocatellia bacterium]